MSSCGSFLLACFADGFVELLDFPQLAPLVALQRAGRRVTKAAFVSRAQERAYDTNLYAVSQQGPAEARNSS